MKVATGSKEASTLLLRIKVNGISTEKKMFPISRAIGEALFLKSSWISVRDERERDIKRQL